MVMTKGSEANKIQFGGTHYKSDYEHWDFVIDAGLDYLAGCATKYICRWRTKGGLIDLRKALHFTDKLIEAAVSSKVKPSGCTIPDAEVFCDANKITGDERVLIGLISSWTSTTDLVFARRHLDYYIDRLAGEEDLNTTQPVQPVTTDKIGVPPGYGNKGDQERPFGYDPVQDDEPEAKT